MRGSMVSKKYNIWEQWEKIYGFSALGQKGITGKGI